MPRTREDDDICPSWSISQVQVSAQEICEGKNWSSEECNWFGCCRHSGSECKSNKQNAACMPSMEVFTDVPSTTEAPTPNPTAAPIAVSTTAAPLESTTSYMPASNTSSGIANDTMGSPVKPSPTPAAKSLARGRAKLPAYMSPVLSPAQRTVPMVDTSNPRPNKTQSVPSTSRRPATEKKVQPKAGQGSFPDDWKKDIVDAIRDAMKEAAKEVLAKHLEKFGYPIKKQAEKVGAEEDAKKDKAMIAGPEDKNKQGKDEKAGAEEKNKEGKDENAGAEEKKREEKACKDISGKYKQNGRAAKLLIIKQVVCSINATVNGRYIGSGLVDGDDVNLMGWSVGNVTQNGTLRFADGSLWSQSTAQVALPPGHGQHTITFDGVALRDLGMDHKALAAKLRQKMSEQGLLPAHHEKLAVEVREGLLEIGPLALIEGAEEDPSITVVFTAPHEVLDKIKPMDLSLSGRVPRVVASAEGQENYTSETRNSSSKLVDGKDAKKGGAEEKNKEEKANSTSKTLVPSPSTPVARPKLENASSSPNQTAKNVNGSTPVANKDAENITEKDQAQKDAENTTLTFSGGGSGGSASSSGGGDFGHTPGVTKIAKIVKNRPVIEKGTGGGSSSGSSSSPSSAGSVGSGSFDIGTHGGGGSGAGGGGNGDSSEESRGSSGSQPANTASSSTETKNSDNAGIIATIVILSVIWVGLCGYAAKYAMSSPSDEAAVPLQEPAASAAAESAATAPSATQALATDAPAASASPAASAAPATAPAAQADAPAPKAAPAPVAPAPPAAAAAPPPVAAQTDAGADEEEEESSEEEDVTGGRGAKDLRL